MHPHLHAQNLFLTNQRNDISGKPAYPFGILLQLLIIFFQFFLPEIQFCDIGSRDLRVGTPILCGDLFLRESPCMAVVKQKDVRIPAASVCLAL